MRLTPAVAVVALACLATPAPPRAAPSSGGPVISSWRSAPAWRRYKAVFGKIEKAGSLGALEKLEDDALDLERLLPQALGDAALAGSLAGALGDRLTARRTLLQTPRGRLPRPDWKASAVVATEWVDHVTSAVQGLRALPGRDPWVDGTLVPEVRACAASLEAAVDSLERKLPEDPEVPALVARARAALAAASAVAGEPPPAR